MAEREALILGALLHDIGKFMQRRRANTSTSMLTSWINFSVFSRTIG